MPILVLCMIMPFGVTLLVATIHVGATNTSEYFCYHFQNIMSTSYFFPNKSIL